MLKAVCNEQEYEALTGAEKAHYRQDGTRYFLEVKATTLEDSDGSKRTYALENITGLQNALGRLRTEVSQYQTKLSDYERRYRDLDPEEARTAIEKVKQIGDARSDEARHKELEAVRASVEAQYKKQMAALEGVVQGAKEKVERYSAYLRRTRLEAAAAAAIEAERGSVALLLPHVVSRCRVVPDPSDPDNPELYAIEVVDAKGQPRYSCRAGATSAPMSLGEYVSELKSQETYAVAFDGARAAGSGASGSSSTSRTAGRTIRASDRAAIEANVDRIARGEVSVVDG